MYYHGIRFLYVLVGFIICSLLSKQLKKKSSIIIGIIYAIPCYFWIIKFPDIDIFLNRMNGLWANIFMHRSILTHNMLPVLFLAIAGKKWLSPIINKIAIFGASSGLIIHLISDLFPRAWWGKAFIHFPFIGALDQFPWDNDWIPTIFSITWMSLNIILSLLVFLWLFQEEDAQV